MKCLENSSKCCPKTPEQKKNSIYESQYVIESSILKNIPTDTCYYKK